MPLFLAVLAIGLIVIGFRGKVDELGDVLRDDFTSSNNFIAWLMAFAFLGFISTILPKEFRRVTDAFSGLLVVVILLSNEGFFKKFEEQALR